MDIPVRHNAQASRFEAEIDGHLSIADYRLQGGTMVMHHTLVPDALRGRGIAAALVREALAHARSQGLKVLPLCSYVALYMQRHPDAAALRA